VGIKAKNASDETSKNGEKHSPFLEVYTNLRSLGILIFRMSSSVPEENNTPAITNTAPCHHARSMCSPNVMVMSIVK
jgi:hypothetical protein